MNDLLSKFENKPPEIVFEWRDQETEAEGWVVINSLRGGAAGGGTRMRKGLNKREVESLAKTMEVKFTISGPPIGGAKSGINFDPNDPRKEGVLKRWFAAVSPLLKFYYGTGGDLNPRALAKGEGSFGIAQWNPSEAAGNRLGGLYSWAASKNLSPSNLYTQLLYTKKELTSYAYLGLGQLREASTPAEASVVFEKKYERPAAGSTDSRIKYAEEIYEKMEEGAAA